ncbi:MAG TPA: hypothetical protein VNL15_07840 [Dehalococcoidia bacterium]|nr:hypothetical protein [Dehalococcoidia bacterium]
MRFLFGLLLGLALGASLGLLLVPHSESESRRASLRNARRESLEQL